MTAVVPDPVAVGARTPVRTATPRRYLMCPPTHFAVEYAINPWMLPGTRVDRRARPRAVGRAAPHLPRPRPRRRPARARCPACPTWCTRPTAPPSSTGPCSPPGSATRSAPPRPPRTPRGSAAPAARVVEPEFVNEGEGDLLVVGDLVLAGSRLPHRPARPRRGRPGARPRGRAAGAGRPALLPPRHRGRRARRHDDRLAARGVQPGLAGGAAGAVPRRGGRRPGRRRRPRAQRRLRRPPRRAARPGHPAGRRAWPSAGSSPSRSTCPSCSRAAADRSAARWRCAHDRRPCRASPETPSTATALARGAHGAPLGAQLPPAARGGRATRRARG